MDQVAAVFEGNRDDTLGSHTGRAFTKVRTAYDNIKLDFYHRLIQ